MMPETGSASRPADAAWSDDDLRADPHAHAEKAEKVRRMFASIAGSYDLNNTLHSLGRDAAWRRAAVRAAGLRGGEHVLDVACGTGALTRAFARARPAPGRVVGVDYTREMLRIAEERPARAGDAPINYAHGDAMALAQESGSFDVVSIAFGIRNVASPETALREFRRVLREGGRLVALEFSKPRFGPAAMLNDVYCGRIMPWTATLIAGDRSGAYKYLPRSVGSFVSREAMAKMLERAGFVDVVIKPMTLGICVCYSARAS